MGISLRHATNGDIEDVVRVIRTVYDEYGFAWEPDGYHRDLYDLEMAYFASGDQFWVASLDGKVVGTVALELFEAIPGDPDLLVFHNDYWRIGGADCSVERLYVHPEARRIGIARAMVDRIICDAKILGRSRMEIWSDKKFTAAHELYQQYGAKVIGDRLCDDAEQSPEWGLILHL